MDGAAMHLRRYPLVALALVVLVYGAAAIWLFLVAHDQRPVRADAVVVLSGSKLRLPVGVMLVRRGDAPLLVVSRNDRPSTLERRACDGSLGLRSLCLRAKPFSTQGEARLIARLARQRGWRTVDVVTSQFHVFRARFMIARCYSGRLAMVGAPNPTGWTLVRNVVLEPVKLAYHEVRRGC
jgi:uncharacterized SAM-binding protein YcdF (DUF218 family)